MGVNRGLVAGAALVVAAIAVVAVGAAQGWIDPSPGPGDGEPGSEAVAQGVASVRDAPMLDMPPASVRVVATGLRVPWGLAFLPDGTALVSERDPAAAELNGPGPVARILSVTPAGKVTEVQRIPGVRSGGESGLLGLAVSPHYTTDRWVYAYHTTPTDNRIVRFHLGGPVQPVLTGIPGGEFHDGGRIAFGPDGMLYAGTGETYLRPELAQDRASLGGKILRMTPDGQPAPGNPDPGSVVWSLGHRNVQGLAWDARGRMYASELGLHTFDELNRIEPGRNYGWPRVEGTATDGRYTNPIATWPVADASPSGIAVLGDHVYLACLRGQRLYRINLDGTGARALLVGRYGRLRHVAGAPDGALWILTTNRDGRGRPGPDDDRVLRLNPAALRG